MVLGISLADVLLAFKRIFGADIGLLIKKRGNLLLQDDTDALQWDFQISALTDRERNSQILKTVSQLYPDIDVLNESIQVNWHDLYQQVKLFPLDSIEPDNANLVVITDVTATVNNIHASI